MKRPIHFYVCRAFATLSLAALTACGISAVPQRSPVGPVVADVFEPLELIGVTDARVHTRSGPMSGSLNTETFVIPEGTEFIVPVLAGIAGFQGERLGTRGDVPFGFLRTKITYGNWTPREGEDADGVLGFADVFSSNDPNRVRGITQHYRLLFLRRRDAPLVPGEPAERWRLIAEDGSFLKRVDIANADSAVTATDSVRAPAGTERIITALQGFILGYGPYGGSLSPYIYQPPDPDDQNIGQFQVIADTDPSGALTATLELRDDDGIEPWYGAAQVATLAARPEDGTPGTRLEIVGILGRGVYVQFGGESADDETEPGFYRTDMTAQIPSDTDLVVPLVNTFTLNYGDVLVDPEPPDLLWSGDTHQLGVMQAGVLFTGIGPGPTPEFRHARFRVTLGLRDSGPGDRWTGGIGMTLLCLRVVDG